MVFQGMKNAKNLFLLEMSIVSFHCLQNIETIEFDFHYFTFFAMFLKSSIRKETKMCNDNLKEYILLNLNLLKVF